MGRAAKHDMPKKSRLKLKILLALMAVAGIALSLNPKVLPKKLRDNKTVDAVYDWRDKTAPAVKEKIGDTVTRTREAARAAKEAYETGGKEDSDPAVAKKSGVGYTGKDRNTLEDLMSGKDEQKQGQKK